MGKLTSHQKLGIVSHGWIAEGDQFSYVTLIILIACILSRVNMECQVEQFSPSVFFEVEKCSFCWRGPRHMSMLVYFNSYLPLSVF